MSFNTINYLIFKKENRGLDNELLNTFNPYITTKTFSFYNSGEMVPYINQTLNLYGDIFLTVEDQFKFYNNIIPKKPYRKITYIKKPKIEKIKDPVPVPEFYSKRELDLFNTLTKYFHERPTSIN
jgi:predicted rRNA methylase YqxC with S4 and FtsJ domains